MSLPEGHPGLHANTGLHNNSMNQLPANACLQNIGMNLKSSSPLNEMLKGAKRVVGPSIQESLTMVDEAVHAKKDSPEGYFLQPVSFPARFA